MIAHLAAMPLPEVAGWAVIIAAALFTGARYAEAGITRLARRGARAARDLTAYGRTRTTAMRRPGTGHGAHRRTTTATFGGNR